MFSDEDTKEIFRFFPPQKDSGFLPSLILSSGGHGFVTLAFTQAQFRSCVTQELNRISVRKIADDLDVDTGLVRQLVRTHPGLALLSADSRSVITTDEREKLSQKLNGKLAGGVSERSRFAAEYDLDEHSVKALLTDVEGDLVESNGYIFSKTYEQAVSEQISESLQQSISNLSSVNVLSQELPGAPPSWFTHRVLRDVLNSCKLADAYFVKESSEGAQCSPKKLVEQNRDAIVKDLQSGQLAYINLQNFQADFPEIYSTIEEAAQHVRAAADVKTIDTFAVSKARERTLVKTCAHSLIEVGHVDISHILGDFPGHLRSRLSEDFEREIVALYEVETSTQLRRIGDFLLTPDTYESEQRVLMDRTEADAGLQWQQLQENPENNVRFSVMNITALIKEDQHVVHALVKEKGTEKAVEEHFWATVSQREADNEADFSEFWRERVQSRCQIYVDGLAAVDDEKLRNQLSEILAMYAKKELIPETIAKARSQGLVLSRRSRKNLVAKDILDMEDADLAGVLAALKKLNKKQGMEPLDSEQTQEAKEVMINDMIRRMQKQKKSDGPVLFLTLVLILFAKRHGSVLYATGKFAPRLLKLLKPALPAEQFEQIEKWKEAAKTSSLTAEDRAAMKLMAEA